MSALKVRFTASIPYPDDPCLLLDITHGYYSLFKRVLDPLPSHPPCRPHRPHTRFS